MMIRTIALFVCVSVTRVAAAKAPVDAAPKVVVDARAELIAIVGRLAGLAGYTSAASTRYTRDVDNTFTALANHPAVTMTRELRDKYGIDYNAPLSLAVYLDDQLRPLRPLQPAMPPGLDARWQNAPLNEYLGALRDFRTQANVAKFFAAHKSYYAAVEDRLRHFASDAHVSTWLAHYFQTAADGDDTIVPGLLLGNDNYGATAVDLQMGVHRYQFVGLEHLDNNELPTPGELTLQLLVHETAHAWANPLVDNHAAELEPSFTRIFAHVANRMKHAHYGTWKIVAYESLTRAATLAYLREHSDDDAAKTLASADDAQGFTWTADLADALDAAKKERGAWTFADVAQFFAALVPKLDAQAKERFHGPINAVFDDNEVFVTPRPNAQTQKLIEYVKHVRDHFRPDAPLVAPNETDWKSLEGKSPVLYGSAANNALIADMLWRFRWTVNENGVRVAGRQFNGKHLILVTCQANPGDKHQGVVMYTAAHDDDLENINNVFIGPTDWVVVRRQDDGKLFVVDQGNFGSK